jgi:aspartyl-tRNA(Asn)/glutamyl-tRNA(Gln) amidotransferase subunit A
MATGPRTDSAALVRALLAAAGVAPPEPEIEAMIASYPALRAAADGLFDPAIARCEPQFLPTDSQGVSRPSPAIAASKAPRPDPATTPRDIPASIAEAAATLRAGRLTSVELTTRLLARADRLDATLGTFIARFDETARAAARAADADFAAGIDRGPLQGIPLGIKDIIAAREGPTTACSRILLGDPDWQGGVDAPVVARLRAQGAVILGKTTTLEFAIGPPDPEGLFPLHRNPWNLERWPGGSSAGTATGVAAGLILGGLGSDTGGSIRIPAALCGLSGLKPSFGLVPKSGVVPLGYTLDTVGPMARSARDCALILQAIAGPSPDDATSVARPPTDYSDRAEHPDYAAALDGDLAGLRIGVARAHHVDVEGFDAACRERFEAAVDALERAGARPVEVELEGYPAIATAALITSAAESFAHHRADLRRRFADYGRGARHSLVLGALYGAADYVQAQKARAFGQAMLRRVLDVCDVVVTPTMGLPAPRLTDDFWAMMSRTYTPAWNLLGTPAMSIPMGPIADGLPSGLQIIGARFDDATVLRVADAYQRITDWHRAWPAGID